MYAFERLANPRASNGYKIKNFNSYLPFSIKTSKNLKHPARFAAPSPQSKESKVHSKKMTMMRLRPKTIFHFILFFMFYYNQNWKSAHGGFHLLEKPT